MYIFFPSYDFTLKIQIKKSTLQKGGKQIEFFFKMKPAPHSKYKTSHTFTTSRRLTFSEVFYPFPKREREEDSWD